MLQFLEKLKPYTKLVPETLHEVYPSKFICDRHYHHYLVKDFLQLGYHIELQAYL